jgi:glycerol-3-phosphate dehydrogenase (NAD+)
MFTLKHTINELIYYS